ncbi:MAG: Type 1 glutamine amidotransferase-like domain-containing protein [Bacteroidota bacterium]
MNRSGAIIERMRDEFFMRRGWQLKKCPICFEDYYTKRDLPNCGSYQCVEAHTFMTTPVPKSYLEFDACLTRFREFFEKQGYLVRSPIAVIRNSERTLFASTAGQIYDEFIYGSIIQSEPCQRVVLQPVIRLQSIEIVSAMEGVSTSFVHAATEGWNVDVGEHFNALDRWLDFFSYLGLHVGGLCLKIKQEDNDWMDRIVTSEIIRINYGGLEIGVANFFINIPQGNNTTATLSDIGVGIERLVWAVNKSPSYFDSIGPISCVIILQRPLLDAIRTATLMVASGLIPGHKDKGSKLRMMIGLMADQIQRVNLYELVRYYYDQWTSLIELPVSREQTYLIIWREANRILNIKTNRVIGVSEQFEQSQEEFLRRAVRERHIPMINIWNIVKKNHMEPKTINIFLAGGGSAEDSGLLDEHFVKAINHAKPLVYIPNAMKSRPYQSCLEWLRSVMIPLGVTNIEMWDDLRPRYSEVSSIAGIYIGGGDTMKLLKELRESDFNDYLFEAATAGVPLYGGSAGAIILGEDIRTAPEAKNLNALESVGLKIISGYSIFCHYNTKDENTVRQLSQSLSHNIIAIPEKAGGHLSGGDITNYGTEPISIFQAGRITYLEPNRSIPLLM